jgi:hypothetical protein
MNIISLTKNNVTLCAGVLVLATVCYLGYRVIKWITKTTIEMAKIHQIAQERISQKITTGQGEYVVFYPSTLTEKKNLTKASYSQVYAVINQFSPIAIINEEASDDVAKQEKCEKRYELIKLEIKKIDSDLEVAFVPSTLYELIFIRKCIEEDLKQGTICPLILPINHTTKVEHYDKQNDYDNFVREMSKQKKERKCWHLCCFEDFGENDHPSVEKVAQRLNEVVVETLKPTSEGFSVPEFIQHVNEQLNFFKNHHKTCCKKIENVPTLVAEGKIGPTINFGYEEIGESDLKPMGIRDDKDAQIIRNAVALECSEIAKKSFLIFRGADYQMDSICRNKRVQSLSYGYRLFSGGIFDGGATAYTYMRNAKNAYATPVPFEQLKNSPFYISIANTVALLFSRGEIFHCRTKAPKGYNLQELDGINIDYEDKLTHLESDFTKEELLAEFQSYHKQAIQLK